MLSHLRLARQTASHGWRPGIATCHRRALDWQFVDTRGIHVMKDSWPKLKAPADPQKPASAAHIIRAMETNKTEGSRVERRQRGQQSAHAVDHPYMFPDAATAKGRGVSPQLPPMPAIPNAPGPKGATGAMAGGSLQQPPGWEETFAGYGTTPLGQARGKRKKDAEQFEGPKFEVYGMRVVACLVVAIIYMELREYSYGPTGWERKMRPVLRTD
mmetsp:Transcript_8944/g.16090  ORF Transcript_8944/g.16090 Transcript_8944/m.16090 type:complete len:214 (+) Transcript_8944:111-752(+)